MVDLQRENGTVACSDALAVTYDSTSPGDDDKGVRSKLRTQWSLGKVAWNMSYVNARVSRNNSCAMSYSVRGKVSMFS